MSSDERQATEEENAGLTQQDSDDDFGPHPLAEDLVQWFTQNGGKLSQDVQVVYSSFRGFHMRAMGPLHTPAVVTCPLKLTLSCLNLDPKQQDTIQIDSPLQHLRSKIPDYILPYLLLIEQRQKGPDSPWHAYITCLPELQSMTTPLCFNEDDLKFLAGTSLAPATRERKSEYHRQWEHAKLVMTEARIALADTTTFDSILWAATIFTSRAFISTHILPNHETVPILFPVVDILNHSVTAKVEWDFQPYHSFSLKLLEGDTFTAGQELFNNYAPKQNDELLLGYGFCLEDNPIEQFPLKLAFPAALRQYAEEMGLMRPENVPFSMNVEFLAQDLNSTQHFLRAKNHPFGRYENHVPFFRGIPPQIVHLFFTQTLLAIDADINDIDIEHPGPRITVQVLTLLHQAITQRAQTLPLSIPQHSQNEKQKYAKIYRDGQAKIIHSIRKELETAISKLRTPAGEIPLDQPALISLSDALTSLPPTEAERFQKGIGKHGLVDQSDEPLIWTLLFVCLAAYTLAPNHPPTNPWLQHFYTLHPLPALEDGIEDADTYSFIDINLSDFLALSSHDDVLEALDNIGEMYKHVAREGEPALVKGRTENLSARIIMWGMRVVEKEMVPVLVEGVVRQCVFVGTGKDGERWMEEE